MHKPASPEAPREEYLRLQDAIQQLAEQARTSHIDSTALRFCEGSTKEVSKLAHDLARSGHRRFAPLAAGTHAFALQTTAGQIIRIEDNLNAAIGRRAIVHEELQPIQAGECKKDGSVVFCYEFLPKLDTRVSPEDAARFHAHIRGKGYKADHGDADDGNLGYLPDGTVIGVDKNALKPVAKPSVNKADKSNFLVSGRADQESIFEYLHGSRLISKQEKFFPAVADGRIRGVLSDDDITRLRDGKLAQIREKKPECFRGISDANLDEFIHLVQHEGWYPSQAREIMREHGTLEEASAAKHIGEKSGGSRRGGS